jgi:hypothetical protein
VRTHGRIAARPALKGNAAIGMRRRETGWRPARRHSTRYAAYFARKPASLIS